MPEQLTKHPDVTLQVLRSAGAQCGSGDAPAILKTCPADRLCKLPGGELCVYGVADAARMTQLAPADWQTLVQVAERAGTAGTAGSGDVTATSPGVALAFAVGLLLLGVFLGWMLRRGR